MNIVLDLKNYSKSETVFKRTAARAIINNGEKYLMIFSKYGDYKFPGGGVEKGEEIKEALVREVQEETGYHVTLDSIREYGTVFERRKGTTEDILEMDSHYFFCEIKPEASERNLDEYEEEYNYQVVWLTLAEAIEKNKQVTNFDECPWIIRDTKVMEYLLNKAE